MRRPLPLVTSLGFEAVLRQELPVFKNTLPHIEPSCAGSPDGNHLANRRSYRSCDGTDLGAFGIFMYTNTEPAINNSDPRMLA